MNEPWVLAIIGGLFGGAIAYIPYWVNQHKQPSRITTDAVSLVDASGTIISNLTDEIQRLENLLAAARTEAGDLRTQLNDATVIVANNAARIRHLEQTLMTNGFDPATI